MTDLTIDEAIEQIADPDELVAWLLGALNQTLDALEYMVEANDPMVDPDTEMLAVLSTNEALTEYRPNRWRMTDCGLERRDDSSPS